MFSFCCCKQTIKHEKELETQLLDNYEFPPQLKFISPKNSQRKKLNKPQLIELQPQNQQQSKIDFSLRSDSKVQVNLNSFRKTKTKLLLPIPPNSLITNKQLQLPITPNSLISKDVNTFRNVKMAQIQDPEKGQIRKTQQSFTFWKKKRESQFANNNNSIRRTTHL